MSFKPWLTTGAVLLVYGIGAISGWFSNQLAHRTKENPPQLPNSTLVSNDANTPFEEMLNNQLQLSTDQKSKIHDIMLKATDQAKQIRAQIQPQMQQLRVVTLKSIEAELEPDQKKELDLLRRANDIRRKRQRATSGNNSSGALDLGYPNNRGNPSDTPARMQPLPTPDAQ